MLAFLGLSYCLEKGKILGNTVFVPVLCVQWFRSSLDVRDVHDADEVLIA